MDLLFRKVPLATEKEQEGATEKPCWEIVTVALVRDSGDLGWGHSCGNGE